MVVLNSVSDQFFIIVYGKVRVATTCISGGMRGVAQQEIQIVPGCDMDGKTLGSGDCDLPVTPQSAVEAAALFPEFLVRRNQQPLARVAKQDLCKRRLVDVDTNLCVNCCLGFLVVGQKTNVGYFVVAKVLKCIFKKTFGVLLPCVRHQYVDLLRIVLIQKQRKAHSSTISLWIHEFLDKGFDFLVIIPLWIFAALIKEIAQLLLRDAPITGSDMCSIRQPLWFRASFCHPL
mmetsp:Transcript_56277/g.111857  ORF Transcript_56277/g.111857 Transcript_56277/m.111857 type:complete len:232 (-) Transcript_56277:226-921(-)